MDVTPPRPTSLPAPTGQEGSLAKSLKDNWMLELENCGCSIEKGKTIEEYARAFKDPEKAPKSAKALQALIGGDFKRVRIAFKLLVQATRPLPIIRDKSTWFVDAERRVNTALENEMMLVWQAFDTEVQNLVDIRTRESLHQISMLDKENEELAELVDELQRHAEDIEYYRNQYKALETELARVEQVYSELRDKYDSSQSELKSLLLINSELANTKSRNEMLGKYNESLEEDKKRLTDENRRLLDVITKFQKREAIALNNGSDGYPYDDFIDEEFLKD
ncbi:hypothetical protein [Vibrio methylphosphonaticus]|uniref:hypothetical protein n=1 Tax=Vibrio methylphosphonaticus TaxID=2946866 RepID=UPI00202A9595|nr:hypothetical protein [Vibrio methylphosphonaticus]MCL9774593.1 hypothetical protein [Vibrio methylphosphonaticus]